MAQRLRIRVGEPLRGICASLSCASKRSSGGASRSVAIALSRARLGAVLLASFMRRMFFSIELFFAIWVLLRWRSVDERHLETAQEGLGLRIGLRRRDNDDIQPAHRIHAVVIDLG